MRVVGDNVEQPVVLPIRDALKLADEMELDLIEISPKADPPVCRIADYQKFLYQQKKKAKELKANQAKVTIKEIRFGPQTDDHDYNFKLKHAENFLKEGSKVKAYVFFRGRSIVFKEQGEILLLRFATDLEELAKVESMPKLDGKKMNMILAPKSKNNDRPRATRAPTVNTTHPEGEITFSLGVLFEFTTPNISRPNRNWNWGPGAQAGKFRFARFAAGRADNRAEKEENKKLSLTCRPPFTIFVEDRIRL